MKNLEQLRAANAMERVGQLRGNTEKFRKSYRAYVDRLSPTIVMNGLGQALASERSAAGAPPHTDDDKKAHQELYISLQAWLCRREGGVYPGQNDLLHALMNNDESFYLHAQAEALAWLLWHKKFCRAEFPRGEVD